MSRRDAPTQVKVRTDPQDDLDHRYDAILAAQTALDTGSKTDAIVHSCDLVSRLTDVLPDLLEELPPDQAERFAEQLSGRGLRVEYEGPEASIETTG